MYRYQSQITRMVAFLCHCLPIGVSKKDGKTTNPFFWDSGYDEKTFFGIFFTIYLNSKRLHRVLWQPPSLPSQFRGDGGALWGWSQGACVSYVPRVKFLLQRLMDPDLLVHACAYRYMWQNRILSYTKCFEANAKGEGFLELFRLLGSPTVGRW